MRAHKWTNGQIIVLLLDVYSFLDNVKYPMEQVIHRMNYYKHTVAAALEALGISSTRVSFVQESTFQYTRRFVMDQWRLCTLTPQQAVRDAWDRSYNPDMLGPMLCPGLQTLAEEHLDIDFQFGGADQASPPLSLSVQAGLSGAKNHQAWYIHVRREISSTARVPAAGPSDEPNAPEPIWRQNVVFSSATYKNHVPGRR